MCEVSKKATKKYTPPKRNVSKKKATKKYVQPKRTASRKKAMKIQTYSKRKSTAQRRQSARKNTISTIVRRHGYRNMEVLFSGLHATARYATT